MRTHASHLLIRSIDLDLITFTFIINFSRYEIVSELGCPSILCHSALAACKIDRRPELDAKISKELDALILSRRLYSIILCLLTRCIQQNVFFFRFNREFRES